MLNFKFNFELMTVCNAFMLNIILFHYAGLLASCYC